MIFRCQVFPHPKMVDPLAGLEGQERMETLQRMFQDICEFLKSERGLDAAPAEGQGSLPHEERFRVDPALVEERTDLRGVTNITVAYAEDGAQMATAATDCFDIDALYPVIAVCFDVCDAWRENVASLPFYGELAQLMRVDWLALGYSVEYEEGDQFGP